MCLLLDLHLHQVAMNMLWVICQRMATQCFARASAAYLL